jgi:hypothetical protein
MVHVIMHLEFRVGNLKIEAMYGLFVNSLENSGKYLYHLLYWLLTGFQLHNMSLCYDLSLTIQSDCVSKHYTSDLVKGDVISFMRGRNPSSEYYSNKLGN